MIKDWIKKTEEDPKEINKKKKANEAKTTSHDKPQKPDHQDSQKILKLIPAIKALENKTGDLDYAKLSKMILMEINLQLNLNQRLNL